ncbi:alpha/beta fold hydrolase [Rhodococcoides corynebacterioides]|uniref:alpha/beta fold hydrolase n=1 Tax=Rhodococcoides corynebacterioides TaxID=53972 RepID=UPI001C9B5C71|nr:alpha/beta hydrolase [Rhodococcus corynebacterioides]MBY6349000.1 alpha/beta hydrolase [Rhodococcus corynebacterioides]
MSYETGSSVDLHHTADGIRLRYRRSGTGPTIVLLHGTTSSLEHFDRLARMLARRYDVVRVDLPGFGMTGPRPDRDYRITTYARTIAAFLDGLEIKQAVVLGNSLGGNVAWNLALDRPDLVRALILVNATGYPSKELPRGMQLARKPWIRPLLRRWLPRTMVEKNLRQAVGPLSTIVDDAMIDRVHRLWSRPGNKSAFVDFVNTDQTDRTDELATITAPTLVLSSASMPQRFAVDIPGARERINPTSGHLLPEEDPEWVLRAVTTFLDRSDEQGNDTDIDVEESIR